MQGLTFVSELSCVLAMNNVKGIHTIMLAVAIYNLRTYMLERQVFLSCHPEAARRASKRRRTTSPLTRDLSISV